MIVTIMTIKEIIIQIISTKIKIKLKNNNDNMGIFRTEGNYYYKKMIIDSMPSEIESIIDQIQIALQNSTYDSKMDAPIIEWLDKNVELSDQYENSKSLDDNGATRLLDW